MSREEQRGHFIFNTRIALSLPLVFRCHGPCVVPLHPLGFVVRLRVLPQDPRLQLWSRTLGIPLLLLLRDLRAPDQSSGRRAELRVHPVLCAAPARLARDHDRVEEVGRRARLRGILRSVQAMEGQADVRAKYSTTLVHENFPLAPLRPSSAMGSSETTATQFTQDTEDDWEVLAPLLPSESQRKLWLAGALRGSAEIGRSPARPCIYCGTPVLCPLASSAATVCAQACCRAAFSYVYVAERSDDRPRRIEKVGERLFRCPFCRLLLRSPANPHCLVYPHKRQAEG